jgi:hypothetical protein
MKIFLFSMLLLSFGCAQKRSDKLRVQSEGARQVETLQKNNHQEVKGTEKALQKVSRATIAFWVKPETDILKPQNLVNISTGHSHTPRASVRILPGGQLHAEARAKDGELAQHVRTDNAVTVEDWYHVALTIDYKNNEMQFYLNGEPITTNGMVQFQSDVTSNTPSMKTLVGPFEGEVQNIQISGRRLLAVEIKKLEANSRPFMR